uniref:Uncharacterized protein n=1 Tax=Siphoviridae sp. ctvI513 TaxID=2827965 RepID=A0A8S5TJC9_9CAUD|nr:MAG TPA: hypothetical protein [Siphoviridae sp. ctvI513]
MDVAVQVRHKNTPIFVQVYKCTEFCTKELTCTEACTIIQTWAVQNTVQYKLSTPLY